MKRPNCSSLSVNYFSILSSVSQLCGNKFKVCLAGVKPLLNLHTNDRVYARDELKTKCEKVNKHVAKKDSHDCVCNCFVAFPSETA